MSIASKWNEEQNCDISNNGLALAKQMAMRLEVQFILHKNLLEENSKYLEHVHQSQFIDLIMALYEDESIVNNSATSKVNQATMEIAKGTCWPMSS